MYKILCVTLFLLLCASCNTTEQADTVDGPSGFLKDYSLLEKGKEGQALRVYKKDTVSWKKYKKIMIDPVQIWAKSDSDINQIDRVKLEKLIGFMNSILVLTLKENLEIVTTPGADTLRLKVALTEGQASKMILDTLSTFGPITATASYVNKAAAGEHLAVGKASVEAEVIDSMSGERLLAGMDSRYGGKGLKGKFDSWDDLKSSFEFWTNKLNAKLTSLTQ
jgi:hypothetical protein